MRMVIVQTESLQQGFGIGFQHRRDIIQILDIGTDFKARQGPGLTRKLFFESWNVIVL